MPPPPPIRATCPYCGVGCGVLVTPGPEGSFTVAGDPDHPANLGRLRSEGTAPGETLSEAGRLLRPSIMRKNKKLVEIAEGVIAAAELLGH